MTRQYGGLGLGLAISKAIVDVHHGALVARSEGKNQGSTFAMSPPIAKVASADLVLPTCSDDPADAGKGSPKKLRVLLVEDHADTSAALERLLGRRGHEVHTAGSLAAVLQRLAGGERFDVLISDLGLPDGTGHDVLRAVRDKQSIHAIALSGFGMEHDLERSFQAGFSDHLTKPVNLSELEAAIAKASPPRS